VSNGDLSPYDDYKEAACQWMDAIPEHWVECRIKQIVSTPVTDGPHETPKFEDEGVPFLSAESVKNFRLDFAKKRGFISPELHRIYSKKYLPERGDIYMVKSGATTGALAIVETDEEFNIWSPLAVIRCSKALCFDRFVFYSMQSEFFQRSVELSWSFGTQQNIGMGVIENLYIARPTLDEQKQIASFLDYETAKIDALIEKQQQLIALLGEKRQAVISHAVTKGLNPDAPMRDSGVEWLGEVPEHWETITLKHLGHIRYGIGEPPKYYDEGVPLIRATNVRSGTITPVGLVWVNPKQIPANRIVWLAEGDIVVVRSGAGTGDSAIVPPDYGRAIAGFDMVFRCQRADATFIQFALLSSYLRYAQIDQMKMRAAQPHLNAEELGGCISVLPPESEQLEIAEFLTAQTQKLDALIAKASDAIELIQERRTALISAAVTGKIDVRGWKRPSAAPKKETEMEVA